MDIRIRKATKNDLPIIARLAEEIWNEYYPDIIGQEQVDYMISKMYSLESLMDDLKQGVKFLILEKEGIPKGFAAWSHGKGDYGYLEKLYVCRSLRKSGSGARLLKAVEENAARHYAEIRLQVNRFNVQAINFYFRQGFTILKAFDLPIGGGFVMEDYLMAKPVPARS